MRCRKVVVRGKFIAVEACLNKQEKYQINNLILHLKKLEQEKQMKTKVSRRKAIIKIRAEIKNKKIIEKKLMKLRVSSLKR